jgi:hypothetical protein
MAAGERHDATKVSLVRAEQGPVVVMAQEDATLRGLPRDRARKAVYVPNRLLAMVVRCLCA